MPESIKPNQLYTYCNLPTHWVATDGARKAWLFPAQANGWADRSQFVGHSAALAEADNVNAIGTGWPHSGKGDV